MVKTSASICHFSFRGTFTSKRTRITLRQVDHEPPKEKGFCLFLGHCRKIIAKHCHAFVLAEVVQERLNRHSCPNKNGGSTRDLEFAMMNAESFYSPFTISPSTLEKARRYLKKWWTYNDLPISCGRLWRPQLTGLLGGLPAATVSNQGHSNPYTQDEEHDPKQVEVESAAEQLLEPLGNQHLHANHHQHQR